MDEFFGFNFKAIALLFLESLLKYSFN